MCVEIQRALYAIAVMHVTIPQPVTSTDCTDAFKAEHGVRTVYTYVRTYIRMYVQYIPRAVYIVQPCAACSPPVTRAPASSVQMCLPFMVLPALFQVMGMQHLMPSLFDGLLHHSQHPLYNIAYTLTRTNGSVESRSELVGQ